MKGCLSLPGYNHFLALRELDCRCMLVEEMRTGTFLRRMIVERLIYFDPGTP